MKAATNDKGVFGVKNSELYFNHHNDNKTMGAVVTYDHAAKKFASKMGLKLAQDDHTWKFRLHDSGLTRVAL